jgi:hypothetical protein
LRRHYREIPGQDRSCILFDLRERLTRHTSDALNLLQHALLDAAEQCGHVPAVLDWNSQLDFRPIVQDVALFSPPEQGRTLPYLDHTVDVVAVRNEPDLLREARRVARRAVLSVEPDRAGGPGRATLEWLTDSPSTRSLSVSLALACGGTPDRLHRYFAELLSDVRGDQLRDVIVAGSNPALGEFVNGPGAGRRFVQAVGANGQFTGPAWAAPLQALTGDIVVFLRDVLPLGRWLSHLVRLLEEQPDVGIVGGKVLAGLHLESAGGVIFRDGSLAGFGAGDYQVDDPLYTCVRAVDFATDFVAVRTTLLRQLGGLDPTYRSAPFAFADLGFAARKAGYRVIVEPESLAVSLAAFRGRDSTDLVDALDADRRVFRQKWRDFLLRQPAPVQSADGEGWHALAMRDTAVEVCP